MCGKKIIIVRTEQPLPKYGDQMMYQCEDCGCETNHTMILTRKMLAELRRQADEEALKEDIRERCKFYGFGCRFFLQSVIITTPVSKWQFDYHEKLKTLRHENHYHFDESVMHFQFRGRPQSNVAVVDYIATHDGYGYKRKQKHVGDNA